MSNLTQGVMSVTSKFSMDFGRFGPKPEARFGKISPAEVAHHDGFRQSQGRFSTYSRVIN